MDEELVGLVISEARERMEKAVEHTRSEFAAVRTGRAQSALVEKLKVDAYGSDVELRQIAGLSVPEARLLVISPYDKALLPAVAKAIQASDLGITPSDDGQVLRLAFPALTEERRKELVKVVRGLAEDGRVAIRNVRRDIMHELRQLKEGGEIGADDEHRAETELQKVTDTRIAELDELLKLKEDEILEV